MSKGGQTESAVTLPPWVENAAIANLNRATDVANIGYIPYYGPDVAAFSPMQTQAMQMTGGAAQAFGLAPQGFDPLAGIPQAQEFAGGITGYSGQPLYQQAVDTLARERPGQMAAIERLFIDPITGGMSTSYAPTVDQILQTNYAAAGDTGAMIQAATQAPELAMYRPPGQAELQIGDQFVGDDGGTYTVGYEAGQVDPGLANALRDQNQAGLLESIATNALNIGLGKLGFDPIGSGSAGVQVVDSVPSYVAPTDGGGVQIPTSTLTDPETAIAQAYDNTYNNTFANLTYSDPAEEALMSQVIPQQDVIVSPLEPQVINVVDPITGAEYNSGGRVGFGFGL